MAQITGMMSCRDNLSATNARRRIFVYRSAFVNPKSEHKNFLYSSPSIISILIPLLSKYSFAFPASVVLPLPDKPQNWMIIPIVLLVNVRMLTNTNIVLHEESFNTQQSQSMIAG